MNLRHERLLKEFRSLNQLMNDQFEPELEDLMHLRRPPITVLSVLFDACDKCFVFTLCVRGGDERAVGVIAFGICGYRTTMKCCSSTVAPSSSRWRSSR